MRGLALPYAASVHAADWDEKQHTSREASAARSIVSTCFCLFFFFENRQRVKVESERAEKKSKLEAKKKTKKLYAFANSSSPCFFSPSQNHAGHAHDGWVS